jgi:sodium transport system permease protein
MKLIKIIFAKEVSDNLRDRRTLSGALIYPLLGPILLALLLTVAGHTVLSQTENSLLLAVSGTENAPALIQFLQQSDVKIKPAPANPEAEVKAGNCDVVLIIPKAFKEDFSAGRPATVRLVMDDSRQSSAPSIRRTKQLLTAYSQQIGSLRLLARGVNPSVTSALAIEEMDVATPQSQAARILAILPYFIVFSIFIGGMYLAIDTTAGERERGSLEPLVINPVGRHELVLGKLGATLLFTVAAVIETLLGFYIMLNNLSSESLGVKISMGPSALLQIFAITIPMMLLAASLQMIVATLTRSYKEAQTYLGFMPIIPALPGLFLAISPVKVKAWMMLIPTFGEQLLINQVMRGEALLLFNVILSATTTFALGIALLFIAIRMYSRERILFGR